MWSKQILVTLAWAAPVILAAVPTNQSRPKTFELTFTWEKHAPDGYEKEMVLTNGQFPGPVLEMTHGDDIEVTVHNNMPFNTTVHYHGIEMLHTPWSDGVPGLSQRQIQPGASFVYRWKATQAGSYWYHSHHHGQLNDGMYGPIVIHPKLCAGRPFDKISKLPGAVSAMREAEANVKPLVLSDHRHVTSERGWEINVASGLETPCYDSILINGKGRVECWTSEKMASLYTAEQRHFLQLGNKTSFTEKGCLPAAVIASIQARGKQTNLSAIPPEIFDKCTPTTGSREVIEVTKSSDANETWAAFDLIGTFGLITGSFSIDEHQMHVYAVDGSYIEPQEVEAISITNGDRYSVMVKLTKPGDFTVRMASLTMPQMFVGYATLSYRDPKQAPPPSSAPPSVGYINDVGIAVNANVRFFNQAGMKAFPPAPIAQTADQTVKVSMRVAGQSYNWALNDTIYPMNLDNSTPLLFQPDPERHNNVTITTKNGTWVDLIFQAAAFPMPPHPIHKHGNKMYLLGTGDGLFKWDTVAEAVKEIPEKFNLVEPPRRDGFTTPAALQGLSWMAVRYHVNNPGAWLVHCHVQSHLSGGMSMAIQDGVDKWVTVPPEYLNY
ncbi:multicopper oxidase [Colletotrichum graminicola M1.001]|uniref:Multicopper oxidase n=2 Tax=Colletotrichum graminicola TaxID=31870 RepID=E3QS71_COLGM|nr:multicopper oxidase [Colletotrichum graminicola M1.001]EFQ33709.1 multicopper oxidase [Colletotrichum graminicola M1.001]